MAVPEMLHAMRDGRFLDIKTGDIYAYVPPATTGKVASPTTPAVRKVKPSPRAQAYIDDAKQVLARESVETFVCWGLSESGDICFEHQVSQQEANHVQIPFKPILQEVGRTKAVSVWCCHNHSDGNGEASAHDDTLTRTLESALKGYNCGLSKHEIVPADVEPESIEEAESEDLSWMAPEAWSYQLREAASDRLWAPYRKLGVEVPRA
jgi:hypothetical protein